MRLGIVIVFSWIFLFSIQFYFQNEACAQTNPLNPFIENFEAQEQRILDIEATLADHEARLLILEEVKRIIFLVKTFTDMDGKNRDLYLILLSTGAIVDVIGDRKTNNPLTVARANDADLIVVSDDISELNMNTVDPGVPSGKTENQILKETTTPVMIASESIFSELGIGPEFMRISDFNIIVNDVIATGMLFNQSIGGSYATTKVSSDAYVIAYDDFPTNLFAVIWIYEPGDVTFDGFTVPGYRAGFPYLGNSSSSFVLVIARKMAMFLLAQP